MSHNWVGNCLCLPLLLSLPLSSHGLRGWLGCWRWDLSWGCWTGFEQLGLWGGQLQAMKCPFLPVTRPFLLVTRPFLPVTHQSCSQGPQVALSLNLGAMRDTGHGQHPDGIWVSARGTSLRGFGWSCSRRAQGNLATEKGCQTQGEGGDDPSLLCWGSRCLQGGFQRQRVDGEVEQSV